MILLQVQTEYKFNLIKKIREQTGWTLYEAKEAVEHGIIFNDIYQMTRFMNLVLLGVDSQAKFQAKPYKKGGPQDATGFVF